MPQAFRRLVRHGVIVGWLASVCCGAFGQVDGAPTVISNLTELNHLASMDERKVTAVNIEGTVWWSSSTSGRIILKDDTVAVQLELELPCQMPELGDRLVLEGDCSVIKTRDYIKISGVPVVESDGLHPMLEDSGTIHLKAGRHPIRLGWFNRTHHYNLQVEYEGPDVPRQNIPDSVLFRVQTDSATGKTNFVNGLDYRCYEGQWWSLLPNVEHIPAANTGEVDNFDIDVKSRNDHVSLQFAGFIQVPRDGDYTFYVWSDDGSRLFIGEPSLRVLTRGRGELPSPSRLVMEEVSEEEPTFQWSEIEGVVTSYDRIDGALEVDVVTELGLVRLTVAEDSDCSYTLRPQNRIRTVGASRRIRNLDGRWIRGEFFVQHWDDIEQRYITPTIWAEYPRVKIGSLMAKESSNILESVVHLNGRITAPAAGTPWVLEDETGRIILDDFAPDGRVGRSSDVLGVLRLDGSNLVLQCAHFYRLGEGGTEADSLPILATAEQISQLSLEEAAQGHPVRLRGVITSPMEFDGAILQDSSRGIYINTAGELIPLEIGDFVEVEGVTGPFGFQPYVQVSQVRRLGTGGLPDPVQPTWDQLINGSMHCNYVELEGVVASAKDHIVTLLTRDGRINVRLNPIGPSVPPASLGATVRLRGALLADFDEESRRVVVGSISLDQHRVAVIHPAPVDPFSIPLKRVGELLQFDSAAGALQRVKVSGVLLHKDPNIAYLSDGANGLRFSSVTAVAAQVGDRVEVVGFSDLSGPSPFLRDAVVRRVEASQLPPPRKLGGNELLDDDYDSTMVQVEGVLLSVGRRQNGAVLEMQSGLRRFMVMLDDPAGFERLPAPGSRLELTGVYVGQGGDRVLGRPIDSFQLQLNSARDVRVLSRPSWWTFKRLMLVVGLLILVLLAALVWIELLHRKVEERTQELGDQIRQRQRAEHQRQLEHERARLAHDLHDDLGAGLTEVNMLAALFKSPATSAEEKALYADEMSGLALRMVTSLDEIVWAENPRNDTVVSLAGYFGAYAQRLLELASVGCGLDVAEDLPDHALDPHYRRELFLAFKEALTNVIQHAEATKVWLRIFIEDDDLVVVVSDDGCGVLPDTREAGADGLINMQERMHAMGGRCEIQSDPEKGTSVRLQAPIQRVTL